MRPQEAPSRPQEAPGDPQEAPGGPRRPPGSPRRPQEAPGGPREPQEAPSQPKLWAQKKTGNFAKMDVSLGASLKTKNIERTQCKMQCFQLIFC